MTFSKKQLPKPITDRILSKINAVYLKFKSWNNESNQRSLYTCISSNVFEVFSSFKGFFVM